jgi:hypothetical protein
LKQEAPARSLLRNWFGRGNGPVILTTGWTYKDKLHFRGYKWNGCKYVKLIPLSRTCRQKFFSESWVRVYQIACLYIEENSTPVNDQLRNLKLALIASEQRPVSSLIYFITKRWTPRKGVDFLTTWRSCPSRKCVCLTETV